MCFLSHQLTCEGQNIWIFVMRNCYLNRCSQFRPFHSLINRINNQDCSIRNRQQLLCFTPQHLNASGQISHENYSEELQLKSHFVVQKSLNKENNIGQWQSITIETVGQYDPCKRKLSGLYFYLYDTVDDMNWEPPSVIWALHSFEAKTQSQYSFTEERQRLHL